jgi:hypothetical protein
VWVEEGYAQSLYEEGELPAYVRIHVRPKIDVGLFSEVLSPKNSMSETHVPNIQHPMLPTPEPDQHQDSEHGINITFI